VIDPATRLSICRHPKAENWRARARTCRLSILHPPSADVVVAPDIFRCPHRYRPYRVILKRGLLRRGTIEINIDKVASVVVRQSILGRILNFGTVIVRGTGGNVSPLAYVDAPLALRQALRR